MPKNIHTADAMEYTGLAYDQAGKVQQAIQHYQKYLRVYPGSRSGYRIRQRLQILQKGPPSTATATPSITVVAGLLELHAIRMFVTALNCNASLSLVNVSAAGAAPHMAYQPISAAVAYPITASPRSLGISARFGVIAIRPPMISALYCG